MSWFCSATKRSKIGSVDEGRVAVEEAEASLEIIVEEEDVSLSNNDIVEEAVVEEDGRGSEREDRVARTGSEAATVEGTAQVSIYAAVDCPAPVSRTAAVEGPASMSISAAVSANGRTGSGCDTGSGSPTAASKAQELDQNWNWDQGRPRNGHKLFQESVFPAVWDRFFSKERFQSS